MLENKAHICSRGCRQWLASRLELVPIELICQTRHILATSLPTLNTLYVSEYLILIMNNFQFRCSHRLSSPGHLSSFLVIIVDHLYNSYAMDHHRNLHLFKQLTTILVHMVPGLLDRLLRYLSFSLLCVFVAKWL